jgi:putative two-component system response regulator
MRTRDRAIIESLAAAVEAKDTVTSRHVRAVGQLGAALAVVVEPALADSEDFLFGCLLHDVGKIAVPEGILNKPGPLTAEEWSVMRQHPEHGMRMIASLGLERVAADVVRHHHERWDGDGYPSGLSGEQIPLPARIFAVCDALDAMTALRPYREPYPPQVAIDRVRVEAGSQFDPGVVAALDDGLTAGELDIESLLEAALVAA